MLMVILLFCMITGMRARSCWSHRADQQIDLVDRDQLGVERRHVGGAALVVVIDELDRPSQQPALALTSSRQISKGRQDLLAVGRDPPVSAMLKRPGWARPSPA